MILKTYIGVPAAPGLPPVVTCTTIGPASSSTTVLTGGPFDWGKGGDLAHAPNLAKAILTDYLGDEYEATQLHRRFLWRAIMNWNRGQPWRLISRELDTILADIRGTEPLAAAEKLAVDRERPPVASEGGIGIASGERLPEIENKG